MDLTDIINSGNYTLVDVREETELEIDGKFDNAIHIPLGQIENEIELITDLKKPVIIFCRSGNRSGRAVDFLESQGIEDLFNGGGFLELSKIIKL